MPGTSESQKFTCFSNEIEFPKMGTLEVDKSKPIAKLAQDGNDKNFTKKGSAGKKSFVATIKVASGPYTFPLRSHEGPSWA